MCYSAKRLSDLRKFIRKYELTSTLDDTEAASDQDVNGFDFPALPILLDSEPTQLTNGNWWLMQDWQKDWKPSGYLCLNTRIENQNKPGSVCEQFQQRRALLPISGYYEGQKVDKNGLPHPDGKTSKKHLISNENGDPIFLACLYNNWQGEKQNQEVATFSVLTKEATKELAEINNHKKRMPVVLDYKLGQQWLNHKIDINDFTSKLTPHFENLKLKITTEDPRLTLF
jgi:putative SOS response-associated peptidase YedK